MTDGRKRFSEEVSNIVVGSDIEVCARFVEDIDEAAGLFRILKGQSEADRRISGAKTLLRLAKNANLAANALDELDRASASVLAWASSRGKLDPTPSPL